MKPVHFWVNHYRHTDNFYETACNMVLDKRNYPFTKMRKRVTCGNCKKTKLVRV